MNRSNPAIKRIFADVKELQAHASTRYTAAPLEDNLFEWHFTIRGPVGTDFEGGLYHGRILLPSEYPFKPPNIVFLTKNGRFEVGTKICLSISAYHPEHWQPAWGVRTMLEAIISFLPTEGAGAIGALDWSPKERKDLAIESHKYKCPICGDIVDLLPAYNESDCVSSDPDMAAQISQLHLHGIGPTSPDKSSSRKPFGNIINEEAVVKYENLGSSTDSDTFNNDKINKKNSADIIEENQSSPSIIAVPSPAIVSHETCLQTSFSSELDSNSQCLDVTSPAHDLSKYKPVLTELKVPPVLDETIDRLISEIAERSTRVDLNCLGEPQIAASPPVTSTATPAPVPAHTVAAVDRFQAPRVQQPIPVEKDLIDTLLLVVLIFLGAIIAVLLSKRAMHMYQMIYGNSSSDSSSYSQQKDGHLHPSSPADTGL